MIAGDQRMEEPGKRRSDRVDLSFPIELLGTDVSGEYFVQQARTVVLSRHGAAILVNRRLAPTQEMVIRHLEANREAECRVVGQIEAQADDHVYGVALLDPNVDLWGIEFPPPPPPEEAVGRALLSCGGCKGWQIIHLNEFEVEVFQANHIISLYCKRCRDTTLWREVEYEARKGKEHVYMRLREKADFASGPEDPNVAQMAELPRTENDRKHLRVRTTITACIRAPWRGDEVVDTVNVSRGGFCFKSPKDYELGSRIEIALPYMPDSANIFIPARIARARASPSEAVREYGVAYIDVPSPSRPQPKPQEAG